jgi:HEAT repeat protein
LIVALRDWSQPVRVEAALALGNLGKAGTAALPELRLALTDTRRSMKPAAAVALWRITRKAEPLLPVLVRELQVGDLPSEVAAAFAAFGAEAAPAVPELLKLLDSDNPETQMSAMEALGHIGPAAGAARERIAKLSQDPEEEIAEVAKAALEKIAPSERPPAAKDAK